MSGASTGSGIEHEDPYKVLGLTPFAPLDLVVEVYWDTVRRMRHAVESDGVAALSQINDAYGEITSGGSTATSDGAAQGVGDVQAGRRPGLVGRMMGRRPPPAAERANPCKVLTVSLSAPDEVITVAYAFWQRRLRGRLGPDAAPALSELNEAYDLLRGSSAAGGEVEQDQPVADASEDGSGTHSRLMAKLAQALSTIGAFLARILSRFARTLGRLGGRTAASVWRVLRSWANDPLLETRGGNAKPPTATPPSRQDGVSESVRALPPPLAQVAPAPEPSGTPKPQVRTARPPPARSPRPTPGDKAKRPCLVADGDEAIPIGAQALAIGTDPACDVVVNDQDAKKCVVANVWAEDGRVVFHAVDDVVPVRVNGSAAVWAFLEDGDEIAIGEEAFGFRA